MLLTIELFNSMFYLSHFITSKSISQYHLLSQQLRQRDLSIKLEEKKKRLSIRNNREKRDHLNDNREHMHTSAANSAIYYYFFFFFIFLLQLYQYKKR